jgi:tetratricopeptide (TPR) repeat protein
VRRPEEARQILTEITKKTPDYLPAWRRLAEMAFAEGHLDETTRTLDVVLKKSPGDIDARLLLGRVHLARHETDAAVREFRAVLKAEPRFAPAHYQLGLALVQAGDVRQARAELTEAITGSPNFNDAILALARLDLQSGAIQPAMDALERLLARQPGVVQAYVALGAAYLGQNNPDKAAALARKFMAVAPQDARGPDLLGLSLAAQGKLREAREEFERSLSLEPGRVDPLSHLVALDVGEKQVDAAILRVQRQAVLVPKSGAHQALLAELYLLKPDRKLAESALLKAIELDPQPLGPYLRLGGLYTQSGQYDEALTKLSQAAVANPRNPTPLVVSGILYELKHDLPKAREQYEKALAINPGIPAAANNLAWIYSEHGGDQEKALQLAQKAKELAPDDPRISDTLGWILYKRGVYQGALALLKESAAKLGENPQVQYHVGMTYRQLGDTEAARKALTFAVKSTEAFPGKDEARAALSTLN